MRRSALLFSVLALGLASFACTARDVATGQVDDTISGGDSDGGYTCSSGDKNVPCTPPSSSGGSSGGYTTGGSSGGYSSGGSSGGGDTTGCTLTQGYWKNHASAWPVTSLTIGSATYDEPQAIALLDTPPSGDASLVLAHQLIASLLNAATGATTPPSVSTAITQAQAWMSANGTTLPFGVSSSSAAGQEATSLSDQLDVYNNGGAGVPHCK
jgi:hypothetical protein